MKGKYYIIKRFFDIILSIIGLVLFALLFLIIKLLYICTFDFHNIIYKQERIGLNGKKFVLYKFRTMIPNADEQLKKILEIPQYRDEWLNNQKLKNDPRITKIGKILRRFSIDEVPQFINVLRNDMSIVGPRPLVKGELKKHQGNIKLYQSIKPGMTGWWVCNGRNIITYKERLELESFYIKNYSFILDIKCVLKTIVVIFK